MKGQSKSNCVPLSRGILAIVWTGLSKELRFWILGTLIFFSPEETRVISPKTLCAQFARHLWYPVCPLCNTDWFSTCQFCPIVYQSVSTDSAPFFPCKMGIRSCTSKKKILIGLRPNLYKISQSKAFFLFSDLLVLPSETCHWKMACWPRSRGCSEGYTKEFKLGSKFLTVVILYNTE